MCFKEMQQRYASKWARSLQLGVGPGNPVSIFIPQANAEPVIVVELVVDEAHRHSFSVADDLAANHVAVEGSVCVPVVKRRVFLISYPEVRDENWLWKGGRDAQLEASIISRIVPVVPCKIRALGVVLNNGRVSNGPVDRLPSKVRRDGVLCSSGAANCIQFIS